MIIISLAVIPVLIVEQTATTATMANVAWVANAFIWFAFVVEYALMMSVVPDRWGYTKKNWLDVVIIVFSPPVFVPEAMAGIRLLRSLRVFRLFRAARAARVARVSRFARVLAFGGRTLNGLNRVFSKNSMHYVAGMTLLLVLGAGTIFFFVERTGSLIDGIWWAITTMTTVGYGDIAPETTLGRGLAITVMLLGIGFMAVVTANIAAWFVETDQEDTTALMIEEIKALREEVRQLRRQRETGKMEAAGNSNRHSTE